MSDNTLFLISEQHNGWFTLTRHDNTEGLPEHKIYRQHGLTLREAIAYCQGEKAEYGY